MSRLAIPAAIAAATLALAGCGSDGTETPDVTYTDPRQGPVEVAKSGDSGLARPMKIVKVCDGTTLVYIANGNREGGVAVIPDSPECAR